MRLESQVEKVTFTCLFPFAAVSSVPENCTLLTKGSVMHAEEEPVIRTVNQRFIFVTDELINFLPTFSSTAIFACVLNAVNI